MPGEGRSLRSGKDTSSSTNGEKARSNSQSSSSKDKPVPTRAASSKTKAAGPGRKESKKEQDKPQLNGEPIENGVNGTDDVDMVDDGPEKVKVGTGKDGEDEMTVVVPPPKSSKLAGDPGKDAEGDIAMDNTETTEMENQKPAEEDPRVKAVAGQFICSFPPSLPRLVRGQTC